MIASAAALCAPTSSGIDPEDVSRGAGRLFRPMTQQHPDLADEQAYIDNAYDVTKNMDSPGSLTAVQQYVAWDFQPRSSPLLLHVRSLPDLFRNTVDRLQGEPGGIKPIPAAPEDRINWYTNAINLDVWWAWWSSLAIRL